MWLRFKSGLIAVLCFSLFLTACDDTEFSNPAFQADLNYELWRANSFSASYDSSGNLVIRGTNTIETVVLTLTTDNVGSIDLGPDFDSKAEFIDGFGTVFTTAIEPDEEVSVYRDLGLVEITSKNQSTNTITGNFFFIAYDNNGQNPMGLSNGIFFEIQIGRAHV